LEEGEMSIQMSCRACEVEGSTLRHSDHVPDYRGLAKRLAAALAEAYELMPPAHKNVTYRGQPWPYAREAAAALAEAREAGLLATADGNS
jgi:hypothetical protein